MLRRQSESVYLGCKNAVSTIIAAGGRSIVNTLSFAGLLEVGSVHAYTAAKGGVISLTRAVAIAYAKKRVRCNVSCPGAVATSMMEHVPHGENQRLRQAYERSQPLGRVGTPEDIAPDGALSCVGRIVVGDRIGFHDRPRQLRAVITPCSA